MEVSESDYDEKGNIQCYSRDFPFGYHEYHHILVGDRSTYIFLFQNSS